MRSQRPTLGLSSPHPISQPASFPMTRLSAGEAALQLTSQRLIFERHVAPLSAARPDVFRPDAFTAAHYLYAVRLLESRAFMPTIGGGSLQRMTTR